MVALKIVADSQCPHLIQQYCIAAKIASFNAIKIVPLITFNEAIEDVKRIHSL